MKGPKVLHLSKLYPPFWGGIETVVYDLCVGGSQKGVDAEVLCVNDSSKSVEEVYDGIKVERCSTLFRFASVYFSIEFIKRWKRKRDKFDVVHVHMPNPLASLALLLFKTNSKVVLHWHSDIIKQKKLKFFYYFLEEWILKRADRVIATSRAYADYSRSLKKHQSKVVVVPIGIDPLRLKRVARSESMAELSERYKHVKVVFSLGRHVYYKGFEFLIEAARSLPDDYVVIIGGKGDLTPTLSRLIRECGLDQKVKLVGVIPAEELAAYFSICKVFCMPSIARSEAFGVVQVEAMSFGAPVVSTSIVGSGVPWVNRDGVSGLVVEPMQPEQLSDAIQFIAENQALFSDNSVKGYFEANFSRDTMNNLIVSLYDGIFDNQPAGPEK